MPAKSKSSAAFEPVGRARRPKAQPVDPYKDTDTPRRAAIYIRVSREEEAEGHSFEAQERECREFIEHDKPHWSIVGVFQDTHTGKNDKRPAFQDMLRKVYEGQADAIVCHHLDRFSRNLHDILDYFKRLEEMNVVMAFAKDRFDFSTEEGRLQFHILAVFADWYLRNLGRETRKGKKSRVLKGLHNNRPPFGYLVGDDQIAHPVPEEIEAIQNAFEMYVTGNYTDAQIADYFNSLGLKTRRGRAWAKDSVREIILNEFYTGVVEYLGDLYPGKHEAIISKELFDQVQVIRQKHARRPRLYSPITRPYLLTGIARCAHCGRALRAQGGKKHYAYYREMSKARGFTDCPQAGKSITTDEAEAQLERIMTHFDIPQDWQDEIHTVLDAEDQRRIIAEQRDKLQRQLVRVGQLYEQEVYDWPTFEQKRDEIRRELDRLVMPDPDAALDAGSQLETLGDVWPHAADDERQQLTRLILKDVYIDLEIGRVVRVVPEEDFSTLFHHHPYLTKQDDGSYRVHLPDNEDI